MGFRSRSEIDDPVVSRVLVSAIPLRRCQWLGRVVFRRIATGRRLNDCLPASHRVARPFRVFHARRLADDPQAVGTFHGLSSPLTHSVREIRSAAGVACPPPSALRVWLPSRRFAPSRTLPVLFRTGSACGVYPSERSPRWRSGDIPVASAPRAVASDVASMNRDSPKPASDARLPGTASSESLAGPATDQAANPPDAPMGFCPLRGFGRMPGSTSPPSSAHALGVRPGYPSHAACASAYRSASGWSDR